MKPKEKLDLAFELIKQWNDTSENKIAPTNSIFRTITGTNPLTVGDWIQAHKEEIKAELDRHEMNYTYTKKGLLCQHNRKNKVGEVIETIQKQMEASKPKPPIEERLDTLEKQIGILVRAFKKM